MKIRGAWIVLSLGSVKGRGKDGGQGPLPPGAHVPGGGETMKGKSAGEQGAHVTQAMYRSHAIPIQLPMTVFEDIGK